tara:strand:+ start:14389 stop:15021 length:633 start_codon:yes stop_codon:yes gene_type:complete
MEIFMEDQAIKKRREDKYIAKTVDYNLIKSKIVKMGFKKAHRSNYVNNIYYDFNDQSFIENIEGETNRTKYRLRWYDNKEGFVIEVKEKNGKTGYKQKTSLKSLKKIQLDKEINKILPSKYKERITNRYFREYFIKEDIRITLDSNLKFKLPNHKNFKRFSDLIIEVKYPINAIYNEEIIKNLGLKLVKFSKFSKGISFLRNYKSLTKLI